VAALATGSVCQAGLVERRDLDQFGQFDSLNQQLRDPIASVHDNRFLRVEVDQRHLDFTAVAGIDRARAVHDRKPNAGSQTRARVDQTHHPVRDGDRDTGRHERTLTRREFDVERAEKIDAGVAVMGTARHRQIGVQAHDRQSGGHDGEITLGRVSDTRATSQTVRYRERLTVPWWWWPPGLGLAALIALEVSWGVAALPAWLPFAVLLPVAAVVLLWLGNTQVRVVGGSGETELWVGDAHLPISVISRSAEVPRSAKSAALGRQLDPAAYVVHKAWVGPMVLVVLDDADDPTPYWLVSCRRPEQVLSALRS
jgi:Protein of unknown function (DUF3093)